MRVCVCVRTTRNDPRMKQLDKSRGNSLWNRLQQKEKEV